VPEQVTIEQFRVLMGVFGEAIRTVDSQSRRVEAALGNVRVALLSSEGHWSSPAATTLTALVGEYDRDAAALNELLADILRRMRVSYQNYHDVEARAVANLGNTNGGRH
jgi:hypothetical protein